VAAPPIKIDVRHVSKTFHRVRGKIDSPIPALHDVSLQVTAGEFLCLVGPSGCGKTTLLRLMHGLLEPDSGQVLIDGDRPSTPGPHAGFVFQSFRLLPWRTVLDNVEFPLQIQSMPRLKRLARAREYLRLVGLEDFEHSYPHELSGGMQQRVGLARALALEPQILLMDEPFAALDAQTREFMQMELARIWEHLGIAIVFVTHSLDEALFLADRIVLMGPRPGTVEEVLPIELPRPRWDYDFRASPEFLERRGYLWQRIRGMVADQPEFRFFPRDEDLANVSHK
jgi:ABC-type nitrate/sulfonate/bicarbonate transport system ATPase subunit